MKGEVCLWSQQEITCQFLHTVLHIAVYESKGDICLWSVGWSIVFSDCAKGWKKLTLNSVRGCYKLMTEGKTWEDAQLKCMDQHGTLASVLTDDEQTMVSQVSCQSCLSIICGNIKTLSWLVSCLEYLGYTQQYPVVYSLIANMKINTH